MTDHWFEDVGQSLLRNGRAKATMVSRSLSMNSASLRAGIAQVYDRADRLATLGTPRLFAPMVWFPDLGSVPSRRSRRFLPGGRPEGRLNPLHGIASLQCRRRCGVQRARRSTDRAYSTCS